MKLLFKKPWFTGLLTIGLMVVVFAINLWIMSLKLKQPYDGENLWYFAYNYSDGANINTIAFMFMIAFYASIGSFVLAFISFLKKNNWGFMIGITYLLLFEAGLILFQSAFNYLSFFAILLTIINIVFIVGMFILLILRKKTLIKTLDAEEVEREVKFSQTKIPFYVLLIDIIAIVIFITTFFIPLYYLEKSSGTYYAVLINVLLRGDTNLESMVYFVVNFITFLIIFLYFAKCLSNYFFDKKRFVNNSKTLISFIFIATIAFFVTGIVIDIVYTLAEDEIGSIAFIPMALMCPVIFSFAIFRGKHNAYHQVVFKEKTIKYPKIEPLLYIILLTAVTVSMLFLPIIKLKISYSGYTNFVRLTGLVILEDYPILDPGYRMVAFLLVVMLISVGITLVMAISSYLSKHKQFSAMVKLATIMNVFFVFIIAVSGYYFQIAKEINQAVIIDIFNEYGFGLPEFLDYDYKVTTDAIYSLMGSLAILILMFIRKSFDREDLLLDDANVLSMGQGAIPGALEKAAEEEEDEKEESEEQAKIEEEFFERFDPCPAFTELDAKVDVFKQDLANRQTFKTEYTTLNELVHFVVDYARNSRLHLSYTPEDIATFVAGLGASKLSILQGMSGTGKTSLPKIFSEAIFGNCEIIEVESSWKDKNELLGYYNEFSMKFTPKKFTQAVYKAALNKDIFTFVLLDEMNLSRIEYYFSDFLSLMEHEEHKREIKLINLRLCRTEHDAEIEYLALEEGNTLKVPPNIWFIGTANRDESTFVISDKVYDRAHTMNFTKRASKVRNYSNPMTRQFFDYQTINNMLNEAKEKGDFDAETNELIKSVEALLSPYNISFGNRILKQIEEFVNVYKACFPSQDRENQAVEKILLSKVVAKLEVKTIDDKESLEMEFEKLNLNQCAAFIKRLDND